MYHVGCNNIKMYDVKRLTVEYLDIQQTFCTDVAEMFKKSFN